MGEESRITFGAEAGFDTKTTKLFNDLVKSLTKVSDSVGKMESKMMKDYDKEAQLLKEKFALDEDNIALASEEQRKRSEFLVRSRKEIELMKQRHWQERNLIRNMDRFTRQLGEGNLLGAAVDLTQMFFKMAAARKGNKEEIPLDPSSPALPSTGTPKHMGAITRALDKTKFGKSLNKMRDKMGEVTGSKGSMMMIGGFAGAGAGIVGTIIQKALEASPIAQSMLKILSTAFTLILRPIGDFFGGFLKPISIRLLKWGAENVGSGNRMFKMGGEVAAHLIAFFSNPLTYFMAAGMTIVDSIHAFMSNMFLPVVRWFDKDAEAFKPTNYLDAYVNNFRSDLDGFASLVTEASQTLTNGETTGNEIKKQLEEINKAVTTSAEAVEETKRLQEEAAAIEAGTYGGFGTAEEQQSELERLMEESKAKYGEAWANAEAGKTGSRGGKGMFGGNPITGEGSEQGQQWMEAPPRLKEVLETINTGLSDEAVAIIANFEAMKEAGILGNEKQHELREQFAQAVEDGTGLYADLEKRNAAHAKIIETEKLIQGKKETEISAIIAKTSEEFQVAYTKVQRMIRSMKRTASYGYSSRGSNKRADGGMITEPVVGVGLVTGETWNFGEKGLEMVTPIRGGNTGSTNNYSQPTNVVINVNVDSIKNDVDLQKLKPIVERAIRETHSRRGII